MLTDIFALGKFDYGVMVRYQNLTRKPEPFRGPGTIYPPEPPFSRPCLQQPPNFLRHQRITDR